MNVDTGYVCLCSCLLMFALDRHSRRDDDSSKRGGRVTMSLCAFNSANLATLLGY